MNPSIGPDEIGIPQNQLGKADFKMMIKSINLN